MRTQKYITANGAILLVYFILPALSRNDNYVKTDTQRASLHTMLDGMMTACGHPECAKTLLKSSLPYTLPLREDKLDEMNKNTAKQKGKKNKKRERSVNSKWIKNDTENDIARSSSLVRSFDGTTRRNKNLFNNVLSSNLKLSQANITEVNIKNHKKTTSHDNSVENITNTSDALLQSNSTDPNILSKRPCFGTLDIVNYLTGFLSQVGHNSNYVNPLNIVKVTANVTGSAEQETDNDKKCMETLKKCLAAKTYKEPYLDEDGRPIVMEVLNKHYNPNNTVFLLMKHPKFDKVLCACPTKFSHSTEFCDHLSLVNFGGKNESVQCLNETNENLHVKEGEFVNNCLDRIQQAPEFELGDNKTDANTTIPTKYYFFRDEPVQFPSAASFICQHLWGGALPLIEQFDGIDNTTQPNSCHLNNVDDQAPFDEACFVETFSPNKVKGGSKTCFIVPHLPLTYIPTCPQQLDCSDTPKICYPKYEISRIFCDRINNVVKDVDTETPDQPEEQSAKLTLPPCATNNSNHKCYFANLRKEKIENLLNRLCFGKLQPQQTSTSCCDGLNQIQTHAVCSPILNLISKARTNRVLQGNKPINTEIIPDIKHCESTTAKGCNSCSEDNDFDIAKYEEIVDERFKGIIDGIKSNVKPHNQIHSLGFQQPYQNYIFQDINSHLHPHSGMCPTYCSGHQTLEDVIHPLKFTSLQRTTPTNCGSMMKMNRWSHPCNSRHQVPSVLQPCQFLERPLSHQWPYHCDPCQSF